MKEVSLNKTLEVTDPEAAKVLIAEQKNRFLEPFMIGEKTLKDAAEVLGVKLNTLHYQVQKLMGLGLLEVAREEPRNGRAQKVYSATAERFVVPFHVTPSETLGALLQNLDQDSRLRFHDEIAQALFQRAPAWAIHVFADASQGVTVAIAPEHHDGVTLKELLAPTSPAVWFEEGEIKLSFDDAKRFQRELYELTRRYKERSQSKGQTYLMRLGLTPTRIEQ